MEGEARLPADTLASGLVLHSQGPYRLRSTGLPTTPTSPQTLHVRVGVLLAAGAVGRLPGPRWRKGRGQGGEATGGMGHREKGREGRHGRP